MGDDGAEGLLEMKRSGGRTFAQDEASCAVFGMPRAAHRLGAVRDLLPLDQLASAILRAVSEIRG
jgi:two-component system chemotaxis response regulator CheB